MIEAAFSWIGDLARFLSSFVPRLVIMQASHRGVRYVRGRHVRPMGPGLHIYWPLVTEVESCPVVRQVLVLHSQLLETQDDVTVAVGGVVEYEITDVVRFLAETENGDEAVRNMATAAIRRVVMSHTRAELCDEAGPVDRSLTRAAQRLLTPYGVRVRSARLADFARVRALHLTGGPISSVRVGEGHSVE